MELVQLLFDRLRLSVSGDAAAFQQLEKRFAVLKLTDPWLKLAATYRLLADPAAFDNVLRRHPEAVACIGDLYAADEDWNRAIAEYTKAITPETKDAKLLAKRAESYEKLHQWDLAVADWTRAGQHQPDVAFERFKSAGAEPLRLETSNAGAGSMEVVDGTLVFHNDGRDRNRLARSGRPRPVATGEWNRVRHPL